MAVAGTTANYAFAKPAFNEGPWHDDYWETMDRIDALLYAIAGNLDLTVGNWANATAYVVGDRLIDTTDASIWQCVVAHTSASSPTTFATDRSNHPTYWAALADSLSIRGAWAQSTAYSVNDVAYDASEYLYGICIADHTSTGVGTMRTDAASWAFIADLDAFITTAQTAVTDAETAQAAAETAANTINGALTSQGDIVYHNGSGPARLAAGTAGQVLQTGGAGQNPSWASQPSMVLLSSGSMSGATQAITIPTGYQTIKIFLNKVRPATDGTYLQLKTSTNAGVSYDAAASDYDYAFLYLAGITGGAIFSSLSQGGGLADTADPSILLTDTNVGNVATEAIDAEITIFDPSAATYTVFKWEACYMSNDATALPMIVWGRGQRKASSDVDHIQLSFGTGNITSGEYFVYGIR